MQQPDSANSLDIRHRKVKEAHRRPTLPAAVLQCTLKQPHACHVLGCQWRLEQRLPSSSRDCIFASVANNLPHRAQPPPLTSPCKTARHRFQRRPATACPSTANNLTKQRPKCIFASLPPVTVSNQRSHQPRSINATVTNRTLKAGRLITGVMPSLRRSSRVSITSFVQSIGTDPL